MSVSRRRTLASSISAVRTGLQDGAGDELERAETSRASGIRHLRVLDDGADEPRGAEVHSERHSVTQAATTRAFLMCREMTDLSRWNRSAI